MHLALRRWTAVNSLEDLDFDDDTLCLMSHKLEHIHAKTNKLTQQVRQGSEDRNSSERREDAGEEDTQTTPPPSPTTTTTSSDHHQQQKLKTSSLFHLSRQHSFNCRPQRHTRPPQSTQDPKYSKTGLH
ncbi:unnamed protein product [Heterobilharzia americana]|nr:unnamed protein product [Heterobilharzia americana]